MKLNQKTLYYNLARLFARRLFFLAPTAVL
jgi:hypothetical protein